MVQQSRIVLRKCRIFDGISEELLEGVDILVVGNRITEIGTNVQAGDGLVIDVGGRFLMPGLIEAHYHAIVSSLDFNVAENSSPYVIGQHARYYLEDSLYRGFTSIRDAGGADYGLADAILQGLIRGPRLFYSGKALTQTGGHGDFRRRFDPHPRLCMCCGGGGKNFSVIADGVPEVRRAAREELRKGASQVKIMASGGVTSPSDPVWNLQYSEEEIAAAVWEAKSWANLCHGARLYRRGDNAMRHARGAFHRTCQSDRQRDGGIMREQGGFRRTDAGHL